MFVHLHTTKHTLGCSHKSKPPLPCKHLHITNRFQRQHLQLWGLLLFPHVVSSSGAGSQVVLLLLLFRRQAPLQLATSNTIKSSQESDQICKCKLRPKWVNTENKQAEEEKWNWRKWLKARRWKENNSNSGKVPITALENMMEASVCNGFYLVVHLNDV